MTAPVSPPQPTAERLWCTACGTVTADGLCDCNRWHNEMSHEPHFVNYADAMQEAAHEQAQENASLKARAEQAEQAVDVLETNARAQAKLLADTGRRVEELEAALRSLTNCADGLSFAERDVKLAVGNTNWNVLRHWIAEALAALPPSSSTGSTDMTLKARNDALHENNVLALRQIEELEAALSAAREYVAGASLAAGTPAYIRCCELLIKIDAAFSPNTPAVSR